MIENKPDNKENKINSENTESVLAELQVRYLESMREFWYECPLALKEIHQLLPDILKTSEQAGICQPVVLAGFISDINQYYYNQKMTQLSKKAYKLHKRKNRMLKERLEFNKLALSRGEIPDHIFQQVQECQKLEKQEASLYPLKEPSPPLPARNWTGGGEKKKHLKTIKHQDNQERNRSRA